MTLRRTQAERREETKTKLLAAARRLFGENGYAETSLEEIAGTCDVTVRPIYHYFDSKLGLFRAVVEAIEHESVDDMQTRQNPSLTDIWTGFIANCEDPHFRQIILVDGPTLLGRTRMTEGPIAMAARQESAKILGAKPDGLTLSMLFGALSSAAIYIAEHGAGPEEYAKIKTLIEFHAQKDTL